VVFWNENCQRKKQELEIFLEKKMKIEKKFLKKEIFEAKKRKTYD
jgi:hypothetical protein